MPVGAAANPERSSWHTYRWRLEPLFLAGAIPLVVGAVILYVITTALLDGGGAGASVLPVVLLITTTALLLFLIATRKPSRKRSS